MLIGQVGLINHNLDAFGFDALHDSLDAGGAEIVGAGFHDQAVDADHGGGGALSSRSSQ